MTTPLEYVAHGWKVFPCHTIVRGACSCTKGRDCESPGKHPRTTNGVKDATDNPEMVRRWLERWPDSNWAVACGAASGILVIDIDPRKNGFDSIDELEMNRPDGPLPYTLQSNTGGSGRHHIFAYPAGSGVGNRNNWMSGVDVKSDGGYIILPEAEHITGGIYTWKNWGTPLAPLPADILQMLLRTSGTSAGSSDLADTSTILQGVPEGERDNVLFKLACRLRRQLGDGARSAVELLVLQAAANCDPPFSEAEARVKVESAWKQNHADDYVDWIASTNEHALHPLTDRGNAYRFRDHFGDRVRFVEGWGWVAWSDTGWKVGGDADSYAQSLAYRVPDIIIEEARGITDQQDQRRHANWALKSQSAGAMFNITRVAEKFKELRTNVKEFDADDYLLNCRNGVVNLRTGKCDIITQEHYITKNTNVFYDPDFTLKEWDDFLLESCGGDPDLVEYLQRAAGYTLTGCNDAECFFIISGPPASGKSTFVDALHAALGQYAVSTNSDTFMYQRGQQTRQDELARFVGMRMVSVSEIRESASFDETLIKQFTGGDRVSARFLYRDPFEYRPQMKLWIATNHDPDARDAAIWRRLKKIAFRHSIPYDKRDPKLKLLLQDPEAGGKAVLAWAVRGAMKWAADGLQEPMQVTMEVAAYHQDQDRPGQFIIDCLTPTDGARIPLNDMYEVYKLWCRITNENPKRQPQFVKMMTAKNIQHERVRGSKIEFIGYQPKTPVVTQTGVYWS